MFLFSCTSGADPGFRGGGAASKAESCQCSKWSHKSELISGQGPGLEFLMLKYAFSHILETLFFSFLTSSSTPYITPFANLYFLIFIKKLCL